MPQRPHEVGHADGLAHVDYFARYPSLHVGIHDPRELALVAGVVQISRSLKTRAVFASEKFPSFKK